METTFTGETDNSCLYNHRHTLNSYITTDYNTVPIMWYYKDTVYIGSI